MATEAEPYTLDPMPERAWRGSLPACTNLLNASV